MRYLFCLQLIMTSFVMANPVFASLIERDYSGVIGGITYDSESNYEWLDLSFTRSMSLSEYQDYLAVLDDSWMFASSDKVSDLFSHFDLTGEINVDYGIANPGSGYAYYSSPETVFIDLVNDLTMLGESMSLGSNFYGVKGFTSDQVGANYEQYMAYYSKSQTIGVVSLGDYIRTPSGKSIQSFFTYREALPVVAPVDLPEPATLGMLALMLCFFSLRKNNN